MDDYIEAYWEGVMAASNGKRACDNPYNKDPASKGNDLATWWAKGWMNKSIEDDPHASYEYEAVPG